MTGRVLLSTAYLPPVEYIAKLADAEEVLIEREENYLKQTYRNRCIILTAGGLQTLTIPVLLGSFHKTPVKEIMIDYSKRWQQVHLRALLAAYKASPFFLYYFEIIEKIILSGRKYLIDLNTELLMAVTDLMKLRIKISYTSDFSRPGEVMNDFRYSISPKKESGYKPKKYIQVFGSASDPKPGLSSIDLIFNTGVDALNYL